MIERRTCPGTGVVAVLARCGEELRLRRMAGVCAVVVIRLMAADTGSRQSRVIAVDVAIYAFSRWDQVRSGQRECRVVVIKRRIRPDHRVMAHLACCREAGRRVRGIICRRVILLMARVA